MASIRRASPGGGQYAKARARAQAELRRRRIFAELDGNAELRGAVLDMLDELSYKPEPLASKARQLAKVWALG